MEPVFYKCPVCGNVMMSMVDSGVVPVCCGKPMVKMVGNTVDAKVEAHVPSVQCKEVCKGQETFYEVSVSVGSVLHPATKEHHICFVYLSTKCGGEIKFLKEDQEPRVVFVTHSKPLAVYAYCNLHALWKTDVECS